MKRRLLVAAWLVGCGGSGEFRPAKNAATFPPTSDAVRVHQLPGECVKLGSVDGESLDEIVEITTKHGGTHYIVRLDHTKPAETSDVVAGAIVAGPVGALVVSDQNTRLISATAFRCP